MRAIVQTRVLATVAVLCAATALLPMVTAPSWYRELVVVLVLGTAANIGVTLTTRAGFGSLAGLLASAITINGVYAGGVSIGRVIPTPTSLGLLAQLMQDGANLIYTLPAPLPDEAGLRVLMVTGLALAWWCADALVGATRSPALAGVPLVGIMLPAIALSDGGVTAWSFALAAAGYLALLLGGEAARAHEWGQLVSRGPGRIGWGVDGLAVAAVAVVAALVVPSVVSGLATRLVPEPGQGDAMIAVVNPMIDLHDNLVSQSNAVVLRYETTAATPEPIRIVADDDFDGRTWQPTYGTLDRADRVQDGLPRAPGLAVGVATAPATTTITIDALRQTWLPTPYPPTRIDVQGSWLYDSTSLNVVGDGIRTSAGLRYTVNHDVVTPTPEQLAAAGVAPEAQEWTDLPDLPAEIEQTAREIAGAGSRYEQALNLQNWLRSTGGFTYSQDAPPETGAGAIVDFLTRRSGYCVHFASTMAVMSRTLGIPARVAVGFQVGQRQPDGSYEVRQRDAHAWPELYFAGVGWVRFEPTPAVQAPGLPAWAGASGPAPAPTASATTTAAPTEAPTTSAAPTEAAADDGAVVTWLRQLSWPLVFVVTLGLVALLAPWATARLARRSRWRRARSPADLTEAAWADLTDELDDLRLSAPVASTVREVAARVRDRLDDPVAVAAVDRLSEGVEQARYAPDLVSSGASQHVGAALREDVHSVATALRAGASAGGPGAGSRAQRRPGARVLRRAFPRSGLRRLAAGRDRLLGGLGRPTWRR